MAETGGTNGGWLQAAMALGTVGVNAISKGGPRRQFKYNKKSMELQNRMNRENAEWAFNKELELRNYQRDYDSPEAQMQRYKDAGLNPNLVYGNGSAAAGSFTPPSAPNVSNVTSHQVDAGSLGNLGSEFQSARLMAAQTDLTRTRTEESTVKQDLAKAQTEVARANPYLSEGYVASLVAQLKAAAEIKQQEARFKLQTVGGIIGDTEYYRATEQGMIIMDTQMRSLMQKFKLDQQRSANLDQDLKIKAEIIKSKEFQNALQQIQVEWMKNAEITPQHIYQGIFMLLQSFMRR